MPGYLLQRLFFLALSLRLVVALGLNWSGTLFSGLSRDSLKYHEVGVETAAALSMGLPPPRGSWVDDAWFQVIGYLYYWLTPDPLLVQFLNAVLGALAAVMTARMAWVAYGEARLAYFSGFMIAVFPSFVYFNALLLKDAASLFLMAALGWAVVSLRQRFSMGYALMTLAALLGFLGIREYMFFLGMAMVALSLLPIFGRSAVSVVSLVAMAVLLGGLTWYLDYGFWGQSFFSDSKYLDLDYINATRESLDRGKGAMGTAAWGEGLASDVWNALVGAYYFFFSVNPADLGSVRQYFALPEALLMFLAIKPFYLGLKLTWQHYRATAIPLLIFGVGVLAIYTSATTNIGALFRWRMQAFPFLFPVVVAGLLLSGANPLARFMGWVTRPAAEWQWRRAWQRYGGQAEAVRSPCDPKAIAVNRHNDHNG